MELTKKMQLELLELAMATDDKVRSSYEKLVPYIKATVHEYLIDVIFEGNKAAFNAINKAYRQGSETREKIAEVPMARYRLYNRSAMGLSRAIKKLKGSDETLVDYEEYLYITGLDISKISIVASALPQALTKEQVDKVVETVVATTTPTSTPEEIKTVVQTVTPTNTVSKPRKPRGKSPITQEKLVKTMEECEVELGIKALAEVARKKGKINLAQKLDELIAVAAVTLDIAPDEGDWWDELD